MDTHVFSNTTEKSNCSRGGSPFNSQQQNDSCTLL